ncbi:hypothetical protein GCM10022243_37170 [Saccharothrix violaceirubra]|uniref:Aminoglycoside phosphotransferase domain-containing protein n=1 Tax=Saccharothrix violaceirubra TaxID=413306 RepID=A0A7W7T4E7_9PSEU|nr:phosphotransferase [Saccharothrix violaceirubra]MBB4966368.1 hypothetical protein [Saccharothrix violaceirubra]
MTSELPHQILDLAGNLTGIRTSGAELIRNGTNSVHRLPGRIIARIGPPESVETARHQLTVSHWLTQNDIPTVRPVADVGQPVVVSDRPVTWWKEIPNQRPAAPAELGTALRRLHTLPPPEGLLPTVDPIAGWADTIGTHAALTDDERMWITDLVARLRDRLTSAHLDTCVIHGHAWQDNVVVSGDGPPILLDLDRLGIGPRDWDLIPLAVDHTDFARITSDDYHAFLHAYGGYDTTTHPAYRTLATLMELRWTNYILGKATTDPHAAHEARHRITCLRGEIPRPWTWTAF